MTSDECCGKPEKSYSHRRVIVASDGPRQMRIGGHARKTQLVHGTRALAVGWTCSEKVTLFGGGRTR